MRDLVTLIGHIGSETGLFAYRAVTPQGEFAVKNLGDCWGAIQLSGDTGRATARGATPEDAVRRALARQAIAA